MPALRLNLALFATLVSAATLGAQPPPRADRLGDLLPTGAIVRIGTARLQIRGGADVMAASADGKRIAAVSDDAVAVWEVPGGREVFRIPVESNMPWMLAFAPDGKTLAVNHRPSLVLIDAASGKRVAAVGAEVMTAAFTADGKTLVTARWGEVDTAIVIVCWDLDTKMVSKQWRVANDPVLHQGGAAKNYAVEFCQSPDGKLLATVESSRASKQQLVRLHDAVTGAEVRRWSADPPILHHLDFSPDSRLLGAGSAWMAKDTTLTHCVWEVATGKELPRLKFNGLQTGVQAVAGGSVFCTEKAGVCRYDLQTGKRLQTYPQVAGPLAFVGKQTLAVQGPSGTISLLDVETGKDACPLPRAGAQVAFAPNGRQIAWSEGGDIVLAALPSGKEVRRWPAHEHQVGPLAFAPDGKSLASAGPDLHICVWDLPAGRLKQTMVRSGVKRLCFSTDGCRLGSGGDTDTCLWDVATGKRTGWWYAPGAPVMAPGLQALALPDPKARKLRLVDPATGATVQTLTGFHDKVHFQRPNPLSEFEQPLTPLFSADGRLLLAGGAAPEDNAFSAVHLWRTATAARLPFMLEGDRMLLDKPAFSPDGGLLAMMRADGHICLINTANGNTFRTLGKGSDLMMAAPPAFTPDGRTLLTVVKGLIQVWEIATGAEICRREGHLADVKELIVAGDGRSMASVSTDGTILIWDLRHLVTRPDWPAGLPFVSETLWTDLASLDAVHGRHAVETLIAADARGVAMLRQRLKPAAAPDLKKVARWIADLDSDDFDLRQKATQELDAIGAPARAALRQALAAKPTLESRRRIEGLLKKLTPEAALSPDALRAVRAVQVLEQIGDATAARLLDELARSAPAARLTDEAAAALLRLKQRTK